jgi:hypothetical protein
MFINLNSQSWWHLRSRFIETFKASQGDPHDPELVISLDPELADLRQLKSELAQALYNRLSGPCGTLLEHANNFHAQRRWAQSRFSARQRDSAI